MGQVIYFLSLNLTRIAELREEDLVKHIRKRTIQTGRLFFSYSLREMRHVKRIHQPTNHGSIDKRINA